MATVRRYSVLFGFDSSATGTTGYVGERGPTKDIFEAVLFERKNYRRVRGWRDPSAWARFFEEETEYAGWKLHPVGTNRSPDVENKE